MFQKITKFVDTVLENTVLRRAIAGVVVVAVGALAGIVIPAEVVVEVLAAIAALI